MEDSESLDDRWRNSDDWDTWRTGATPAKLRRILWKDARVKHDPDDHESKDWDNSEPDPSAP